MSVAGPGCVKSRKNLGRWWASPKYERFSINIVIVKSTGKKLLPNIGFHLPLSNITNTFHTAWAISGHLAIIINRVCYYVLLLYIIKMQPVLSLKSEFGENKYMVINSISWLMSRLISVFKYMIYNWDRFVIYERLLGMVVHLTIYLA